MNIHLHNYEEYFLLYADDELTPEQRQEVEQFVHEHPQYENELQDLLQTIQQPEQNLGFPDKNSLYRKEEFTFINPENYETIFVQYHDGELDTNEQQLTEVFVRDHPQYASAFGLLQTVRFTPETSVVFPDKSSLYKKKAAKVIPIRSWKYMAAALLAGLIFWAAFFLVQPASQHELALHPEKEQPHQVPVIKKQAPGEKQQQATATLESSQQSGSKIEKARRNDTSRSDQSISSKPKTLLATNLEHAPVTIPEIDAQQHRTEVVDSVTITPKPGTVGSLEISEFAVLAEKPGNKVAPAPAMTTNNAETVQNALTGTSNDNYIFYNVPQEEFKKSKVGIFLKKVKRIVIRTNPIHQLLSGGDEGVALN